MISVTPAICTCHVRSGITIKPELIVHLKMCINCTYANEILYYLYI